MKNIIKQLAIIGPTASGKSAISIDIATKYNCYILSMDSLSIYKEIDIASAKPSKEEREIIKHFGIDLIYPNEEFSVQKFLELYQDVYSICKRDKKNLIITGGSSFYLKSLIDGISQFPDRNPHIEQEIKELMKDNLSAYRYLKEIDPIYASKIKDSDRYRIEKGLFINLSSKMCVRDYFTLNPPKRYLNGEIDIIEIVIDRDELKDRISKRTEKMIDIGLVDEVCMLEKRYNRNLTAMKAIGIKEVLAYLDGIYDYKTMIDKIITNTVRYAKRQVTFNKSQFSKLERVSTKDLTAKIKNLSIFSNTPKQWR